MSPWGTSLISRRWRQRPLCAGAPGTGQCRAEGRERWRGIARGEARRTAAEHRAALDRAFGTGAGPGRRTCRHGRNPSPGGADGFARSEACREGRMVWRRSRFVAAHSLAPSRLSRRMTTGAALRPSFIGSHIAAIYKLGRTARQKSCCGGCQTPLAQLVALRYGSLRRRSKGPWP